MPVFTVKTNVASDKIPADFKTKATNVIASSLSKPKSYIAVHIVGGQDISFGDTNEPAALCELSSIGALDKNSNKKHSKALMSLLNSELHIQDSRIYITFINLPKENIGYTSTTFDDLI